MKTSVKSQKSVFITDPYEAVILFKNSFLI